MTTKVGTVCVICRKPLPAQDRGRVRKTCSAMCGMKIHRLMKGAAGRLLYWQRKLDDPMSSPVQKRVAEIILGQWKTKSRCDKTTDNGDAA